MSLQVSLGNEKKILMQLCVLKALVKEKALIFSRVRLKHAFEYPFGCFTIVTI
jgi:hypothetical protein